MNIRTIDDLDRSAEAQREVALRFCEASQEFASLANGTGYRVIPAPVAYDLLGELKVALVHLSEVAEFMPRGLCSSLADPRLAVYDRDPWTGERRNPAVQAELASEHMREVLNYLSAAAEAAADAQVALNGQGYREAK